MNTLDKYRVTVCFFLEPNSSKGVRILVPCQDTWTIDRLKDEALRRLRKNLTSQCSDSEQEKALNLDEIHVKHIENLSKDRLDGDDIIRDVLDNKEILVARLEGDQDVDYFNNDHLFRGSGSGSVAGESTRSTLLPGSQVYPESVQFPLRPETEFGTPERHSVYYPHSYYGHGRHSVVYPLQDDFLDMQPPPRPFGHPYYQGASSDYELPRLHPRFNEGGRHPFPRPDSSNSDVQHGSDPSQFMNHLNSCSPSALSEENRTSHSSYSHAHTFSNPEQIYPLPSSETSPSGGVFTGGTSDDSGFDNHSGMPQQLFHQNSYPIPTSRSHPLKNSQSNQEDQPVPEDTNPPPIKSPPPPDPETPPEVTVDPPDSPSSPFSPSPAPFARKKQGTSVMHGYINPAPAPLSSISTILERSEQSEPHAFTPQLNSTPSPTLSDRKQSPSSRITLRLIAKRSSSAEPCAISEQDECVASFPSDAASPPPETSLEPPEAEGPADPPQHSFSDASIESPISPPKSMPLEERIQEVIETAIQLPEQVLMETSRSEHSSETGDNPEVEPSPSLPQKRAKTSDSPPPTPPHNQLPTTPLNKSIHSTFPPPKEESCSPKLPNANSHPTPMIPDPPHQEEGQGAKAPAKVGVTREIGAIFVVELMKGTSGLGFGIKSRDTAADGMTYPHFVSSIKTNGVAQTDGRLRVGDLLLEVNGTDVTLLTHVKCLDFMRRQKGIVKLKISRQAKLKSAGDPDGSSYTEVGIEEQTMDLVTPPVVDKSPVLENQPPSVEVTRAETEGLAESTEHLADSNTSLDKTVPSTPPIYSPIEPIAEREVGSGLKLQTPVSSSQTFLKQVALTDKVVYTPRGKIVEPLNILLTDAGSKGLGVSVRGKTRVATDGKAQEGGIFVKDIVPGGAAYKDGRLKPNDQILSINGCVLVGQSNLDAMETLKQGQNRITPGLPVIKLVVAKKSTVSSRHGKRGQRGSQDHYARKLNLGSKNSTGIHYANTHGGSSLPSIYHPIRMDGLPKGEEGRVFSVLDTQPDLNSSQEKSSGSPPPDYESLMPEHIYEFLDPEKKQKQTPRRGISPPGDITRFRTAIHHSLDTPEEEHIYARPQRRQTEENIYVRPNKVLYGRLGPGYRAISNENSLHRTPTYTEEVYAQPKMSREELSKRKSASIYEAPVMVKPKYGQKVFERKNREHLYEAVTDVLEIDRASLESSSESDRPRPDSLSLPSADPSTSIERGLTPTEQKHPFLANASKSLSLQKTPSGELQNMYATGRSTPRGPRIFSTSRAVPHAPFSAIKRPGSRSGRVQYPPPVDLSPYFTSVQQQLASSRPTSDIELPVRGAASTPEIYQTTIAEVSNGPTPLTTPRRPPPSIPSIPSSNTPHGPASPNDVTFASEQDDSLGPVEFRRDGQGRDEFSERHPFAKDAKQLITYKDRQFKLAESKLKAMQQPPESSTPSMVLEPEKREHAPLTESNSTPENDRAREKSTVSKRGSFFGGLFKKKKKESSNRNPRDTPSPILEPLTLVDDLSIITNMVPNDDD